MLEFFLEGKIDESDKLTNLLLSASSKDDNSDIKIHEDTPADKFGDGVLPIIKTYKGELIWGEPGKELLSTVVSSLLSNDNDEEKDTGDIKTSKEKAITALEYASELIIHTNVTDEDEETELLDIELEDELTAAILLKDANGATV